MPVRPEYVKCLCCGKKTVHNWDRYRGRYICEICGAINTAVAPKKNDRRIMILDD